MEKEGNYLTGIPHEGGEITFRHPKFKGIYSTIAEDIDKEGLKRPNSTEIASLVYDAFQNKEGQYESEIIDILNDRYFWEFTGNLYLPKSNDEVNNGIILENNPKIVNEKLNMDKNSLIKKIQDNDLNVKFVPFGFKIGEQTSKQLGKNPYLIARYGEEGAEKIAEIASEYRSDPRLFSLDSVKKKKVRMSALGRPWGLVDRLVISDYNWSDLNGGHSFGIKEGGAE